MDYFFSVRGRAGDLYSDKLGKAKYLAIPGSVKQATRAHEIDKRKWFKAVQSKAGAKPLIKGHIVIFVHGFNTELYDMLERHRKIRKGLEAHGFKGTLISFDWPSNGSAFGYSSDRRDARLSADRLFRDGLTELSALQQEDCDFNIHVLAHSMGCFLLREAFDYADDDHKTAQKSWTVSQVALVAADISQKSLRDGSSKSASLLRHSTRVTSYYNPYDDILSISEVKRIGVSRRLGRIGLPQDHSDKAANLYCGKFFRDNSDDFGDAVGISHRWYFDSPRFYEDLFHTFMGKLDREVIPTRGRTDQGNLSLK